MKMLELRKTLAPYYKPSAKTVELVNVPEFQFVALDGRIEPGMTPGTSPSFGDAMQALYGAAYALKFLSKLRPEDPVDYPVMTLEAVWWVEDGHFDIGAPGNWCWRAMILQPDHITKEMFAESLEKLAKKKPSPALEKLRFVRFAEGLCVQTLHVGPYATEPATVARMQAYAAEKGLAYRHDRVVKKDQLTVYDHHEIYLGDPRRAAPEKLKTVLRQPVKKA